MKKNVLCVDMVGVLVCYDPSPLRAYMLEACEKCVSDVNVPMFHSLLRLKESGRARLVLISDINFFFFTQIALKFPEILELFREGDRHQWILSYKLHALKRERTPFIRASADYGFSLKDAAFVDDFLENHKAAQKSGFKKDSLFLYKMDDPKNHGKFEKFLDKHFLAS